MTYNKVATNGAMMHITAIFGITLASLAIRDIMKPLTERLDHVRRGYIINEFSATLLKSVAPLSDTPPVSD